MSVRPASLTRSARVRPAVLTRSQSVSIAWTPSASAYDLALSAWAEGQEWTLPQDSPWHPTVETGASLGFFTPLDVAAVLGWWDPAQVAAFTYLAPPRVYIWTDRVGGVQLVQGSGLSRPTRETAGMNGRPSVRFDGDENLFQNSLPGSYPSGSDPAGVLAAYLPAQGVGRGPVVTLGLYAGGLMSLVSADTGDPTGTDGVVDVTDGEPIATDVLCGSVTRAAAGADVTVRRNGATTASGPIATSLDSRRVYVGGTPISGVYYTGDVGDVLVSTGTESADEHDMLHAWALWKYGRQHLLPDTHPYKFVRPRSL